MELPEQMLFITWSGKPLADLKAESSRPASVPGEEIFEVEWHSMQSDKPGAML